MILLCWFWTHLFWLVFFFYWCVRNSVDQKEEIQINNYLSILCFCYLQFIIQKALLDYEKSCVGVFLASSHYWNQANHLLALVILYIKQTHMSDGIKFKNKNQTQRKEHEKNAYFLGLNEAKCSWFMVSKITESSITATLSATVDTDYNLKSRKVEMLCKR